MADYPSELLSFSSPFLSPALPHLHERVIIDPSAPSAVRVLGKSMHVLAWGWALSVGWLWFATMQQHVLRHNEPPPYYAMDTVAGGAVPAALMALIGWAFKRYAGRAPYSALEKREWWHAFWWSLVPNLLLFLTVWVMLQEAR